MSHSKSSEETGWAVILAVVIPVIYVGLPGFWIWPLWKIYGSAPPGWILMVVKPLAWLTKSVPAYKQFVDWQAALVGIH